MQNVEKPNKIAFGFKSKIVNQKRDTYLYKKRSRTEQLMENYPSDSNFYITVLWEKLNDPKQTATWCSLK